jgi:hypothetical protein
VTGANAMYHVVLTLSYNVPSGMSQGTYHERKLIPDGTSRANVFADAIRSAAAFLDVPPGTSCSVLYFAVEPDEIRVPERRTRIERV